MHRMRKHTTENRITRIIVPIYIAIEIGLLIAIKLPERMVNSRAANALMYLSIVCNALFMLYFFLMYGKKNDTRHENLIALALYITLVADLFLTYLGRDYAIPGVLCFCLVETVYAFYLKSPLGSVILRAGIFVLLFAAAALTKNLSVLNIFALVNISILAVNVFDAWKAKRMNATILFRVGITLFFLCDLCVGLSDLLDGVLGSVTASLIWVFYMPSQVLIALSYAFVTMRRTGREKECSRI